MTSDESSTSPTTPPPEKKEVVVSEEPTSEQPSKDVEKFDRIKFEEEQREQRRNQVWDMHIVQRMSYKEISEKLGVSDWVIWNDLKICRAARVKTLSEKDREFIVEQDAVYEALLNKWVPVAIAEQGHVVMDDEGNPIWSDDPALKATDRVIKALGEQAKLHGFGRDGKVSPKEAGKEIGEAVLKAMRELAHGGRVIEAEVIPERQLQDATKNS